MLGEINGRECPLSFGVNYSCIRSRHKAGMTVKEKAS